MDEKFKGAAWWESSSLCLCMRFYLFHFIITFRMNVWMFISIFSYFHISMQHFIQYPWLLFIEIRSSGPIFYSFFGIRYVNFTWTEQVNFRLVSGVPLPQTTTTTKNRPSAPFFSSSASINVYMLLWCTYSSQFKLILHIDISCIAYSVHVV